MKNKILLVLVTTSCIDTIFAEVYKVHATVDLIKSGNTFTGKVHISGNPYELNLTIPESSVFSPHFEISIPKPGPRGGIILQSIKPSKEEMDEIEKSMYVDSNASAFLKIRDVNGDFQLHGILDNFHISHDGEKHFAVEHNPAKPSIANDTKHIVVSHNSTRISGTRESERNPRGTLFAEPELLIFVDYTIFNNALWRSNAKLTDDLQILVRAVNNRYAATPDPIVRFKIVGAVALTERRHQRFIEESRIKDSDGMHDMDVALHRFSDYMYKYRDYYKKHDIASLLSGEEWKDVEGTAWLGGACNEGHYWKSSRKTNIAQDQDGFWHGTDTLAHELAHNLNVQHDGDTSIGSGATPCPSSDGYIMSSEGWGKPNKFRFSSCSMRQIAEFLRSGKSACLKSNDAPSFWVAASQDPGDRLNMDDQCKALLKRPDAIVDTSKSADELCTQISCIYSDKCTWGDNCVWHTTLIYPALDSSPCGTRGGRCQNEICL